MSKETLEGFRKWLIGRGYSERFIKICLQEAKRIGKVTLEGYEWMCVVCGKELKSIFYLQILQMISDHMAKHLRQKFLEELKKERKRKR